MSDMEAVVLAIAESFGSTLVLPFFFCVCNVSRIERNLGEANSWIYTPY
jgi:hypothetical protein